MKFINWLQVNLLSNNREPCGNFRYLQIFSNTSGVISAKAYETLQQLIIPPNWNEKPS